MISMTSSHVCNEKADAHDTSQAVGMDNANACAWVTLVREGPEEFVKEVFTEHQTQRRLTYSEMRARYG